MDRFALLEEAQAAWNEASKQSILIEQLLNEVNKRGRATPELSTRISCATEQYGAAVPDRFISISCWLCVAQCQCVPMSTTVQYSNCLGSVIVG